MNDERKHIQLMEVELTRIGTNEPPTSDPAQISTFSSIHKQLVKTELFSQRSSTLQFRVASFDLGFSFLLTRSFSNAYRHGQLYVLISGILAWLNGWLAGWLAG